jgi:hypothetical protein
MSISEEIASDLLYIWASKNNYESLSSFKVSSGKLTPLDLPINFPKLSTPNLLMLSDVDILFIEARKKGHEYLREGYDPKCNLLSVSFIYNVEDRSIKHTEMYLGDNDFTLLRCKDYVFAMGGFGKTFGENYMLDLNTLEWRAFKNRKTENENFGAFVYDGCIMTLEDKLKISKIAIEEDSWKTYKDLMLSHLKLPLSVLHINQGL